MTAASIIGVLVILAVLALVPRIRLRGGSGSVSGGVEVSGDTGGDSGGGDGGGD